MPKQSLAVKYRPTTFHEVTEQGSVIQILTQQIRDNNIKHAYLFCGSAGTGKTTCARILGEEINQHIGSILEVDAASNNSVEGVRAIIQQARTAPLDGSKYRVYILDECHMLSASAWNAMLKLLEEPPATAVFIMCTTDPQKVLRTVISRSQRFDFQRISTQGIVNRLRDIIAFEDEEILEQGGPDGAYADWLEDGALEYIAKIADGGMRDAITLLEKCMDYSAELSLKNVVAAIGAIDYEVMFNLTDTLVRRDSKGMLDIIEKLHSDGKDLKLFTRSFASFVLDLCKYDVTRTLEFTQLPGFYEEQLKAKDKAYFDACAALLRLILHLSSDIKWDANPRTMIEAKLFEFCYFEE